MTDILLVHGSCHGAWCWRDVTPLLRIMGHEARSIDLPGHGQNPAPIEEITLDAYAQAIAVECRERTVLVGHSMGGYSITAAAALVPRRIARLVYLCAYVPKTGYTLAQRRRQAPRQPLLEALQMADDGLSFTIDPARVRDLFYHDCPDEAVAYARRNLCPQAVAPAEAVIDMTQTLRDLPRRYIRCSEDRTIPPEFQLAMTTGWPRAHVQELPTGHSPFFADPEGLARAIDLTARG